MLPKPKKQPENRFSAFQAAFAWAAQCRRRVKPSARRRSDQGPAHQPQQQRQHQHHMHRGAYKSPQRRFPFAGAGQTVNNDIDRRQRRHAHCRHPAEPSPEHPQNIPKLRPGQGLALRIKNGTEYTSTVMAQPKNSAASTSATITGVSRASLVSEINFTIFHSLLIGGSLKLSGCFGLMNRLFCRLSFVQRLQAA